MHTIGLIGGMSWYSTAEYYRAINETVQREVGGHASAPLVLVSLDFAEIRECQVTGDWARAGALLADAARTCESAGAETVLICTNLMHKVADGVAAAIEAPLLHIGDAIASRARAAGHGTVGLLGTRWVMEEDFYTDRLRANGLDVLVPEASDRAEIDRVIFDELTQGIASESSRATYRRAIGELAAEGADAVVLGCTEIEMLVSEDDSPLPLIDSMRAHAEAAATIVINGTAAVGH